MEEQEGQENHVDPDTKRCPACGVVKSVDDFYRYGKKKQYTMTYCKICQNQKRKKYAPHKKGPQKKPAPSITLEPAEGLLIDLAGFSTEFEKLCDLAEEEIRSPEDMARAILVKSLRGN